MNLRIIIVIILVAAVAFCAVFVIFGGQSSSCIRSCGEGTTCVKTDPYTSYCVNKDVPAGMRYASPSDGLMPESEKASEDAIESVMIRDNSTKYPDLHYSKYYKCVKSGEAPETIEYFYLQCKGDGSVGCGYFREAMVCGDEYFVNQYHDATGPVLNGPYKL